MLGVRVNECFRQLVHAGSLPMESYSLMMHAPTLLFGFVLLLGGFLPASASPSAAPGRGSDSNEGAVGASASISSKVDGRKGTVVYKGNKVWEGRVRRNLVAIAEALGGRYGDCAAAWDGKKLVWENKPGAAANLRAANLREKLEALHERREGLKGK